MAWRKADRRVATLGIAFTGVRTTAHRSSPRFLGPAMTAVASETGVAVPEPGYFAYGLLGGGQSNEVIG